MFTGLVEAIGEVREVSKNSLDARLTVATTYPSGAVALGDSVCVNGVCLTASAFGSEGIIIFDIMNVTLKSTTMGILKRGDQVNLERSLKMNGRLDGHIVTGHVDGVGRVLSLKKCGGSYLMTVMLPNQLAMEMFSKASLAINGVSLTVQSIHGRQVCVSLVEHTLCQTNLRLYRPGSHVNLETDYLVKAIGKTRRSKNAHYS
jgi:riboflavin synthase